ncbi:MAG: hypothetical protein ACREQC_14750, partial [Candidatus Binataceae bacterium]
CSPAPCGAAPPAAATRSPGQPASLILFVKSQGPTNTQSHSFVLPAAGTGLRRNLRRALEQTSETVLQQADPLLASDYYLNQPFWTVFNDAWIRDQSRAAGATFSPHPNTPDSNCLAEVIFDGSAFWRNDPQALVELARMGSMPGLSATCQMLVQTNVALLDLVLARCAAPERRATDFRAASAALDRLKDLPRRRMSRQEHSRIVAIALQNDIMQAFSRLMDEDSRNALCGGALNTSQANLQPVDYTKIVHLIDRIPKRLPPEKDHVLIHTVVDLLSTMHRVTASHSDLPSRFLVSQHIVQLVHLYLPGDPNPRQLFLAEGRAEMDMAWSALRAQTLSEDQQKQFLRAIGGPAPRAAGQSLMALFQSSLWSAVVAFENAAATSPLAPPLEGSSAMEPTVMLGDAFYA